MKKHDVAKKMKPIHIKANEPSRFEQKKERESAKQQDRLVNEHMRAGSKKYGVKDWFNIGWAQGDTFVHSKTDKGRFFTEYNPKTKKYKHQFTK